MDTKTLFDIFKGAIDDEYNAHELYSNASKNAPDAETRKIFRELARDEKTHLKRLEKRYGQLRKNLK